MRISIRRTSTATIAKSINRPSYDETVLIHVGPQEKAFALRKDVLIEHSRFFRAALSGSFKQAAEQIIRLPEIEYEAFERYVQWTHTGSIDVADIEDPADTRTRETETMLTRLYVVADRVENMLLRNQTMTAMVDVLEQTGKLPSTLAIQIAYEHTADGSCLRRFLVDAHCLNSEGHPKWLRNKLEKLPNEFVLNLIGQLKEYRTEDEHDPWIRGKCKPKPCCMSFQCLWCADPCPLFLRLLSRARRRSAKV